MKKLTLYLKTILNSSKLYGSMLQRKKRFYIQNKCYSLVYNLRGSKLDILKLRIEDAEISTVGGPQKKSFRRRCRRRYRRMHMNPCKRARKPDLDEDSKWEAVYKTVKYGNEDSERRYVEVEEGNDDWTCEKVQKNEKPSKPKKPAKIQIELEMMPPTMTCDSCRLTKLKCKISKPPKVQVPSDAPIEVCDQITQTEKIFRNTATDTQDLIMTDATAQQTLETELEPEEEPEPEVKIEFEPESDTDTEMDAESEHELESQPASESDSERELDTEIETETETVSEVVAESVSQLEAESEPEWAPECTPEWEEAAAYIQPPIEYLNQAVEAIPETANRSFQTDWIQRDIGVQFNIEQVVHRLVTFSDNFTQTELYTTDTFTEPPVWPMQQEGTQTDVPPQMQREGTQTDAPPQMQHEAAQTDAPPQVYAISTQTDWRSRLSDTSTQWERTVLGLATATQTENIDESNENFTNTALAMLDNLHHTAANSHEVLNCNTTMLTQIYEMQYVLNRQQRSVVGKYAKQRVKRQIRKRRLPKIASKNRAHTFSGLKYENRQIQFTPSIKIDEIGDKGTQTEVKEYSEMGTQTIKKSKWF